MSALIKACILGECGVGKSSLTIQFTQHVFVEEYDPTIENSYRKQVRTRRGMRMLEVLDTAGEEEYSAMRDQYMRVSHGFLLVYSITNRQSFDELARYFEQIQRVKDVEYFPGVLIGNKIDLETHRQVSFEEGQQLAERLELAFFETSAKSGMHAHEAFCQVIEEIERKTPDIANTSRRPAKKRCHVQ